MGIVRPAFTMLSGKKMLSKDRCKKGIQDVAEQLIRLYKPEKIILFGSLAEDKIKEGTDIDDVPDFGVDRISKWTR